jgi:glycerophosphoryl diester phosphodiesterase
MATPVHPARIIGHRGAAASAPENTLESFAEAARQGARWVETDAKLSADGAVVLMHDDDLDRTTNGKGPAAKATLAELKGLDAGSWFGPTFKGAQVPTLEEAIGAFARLGLDCNMEIKPSPGREIETAQIVMRGLGRSWPSDRQPPLVSSFSREATLAARQARPDWPLGALYDDQPDDWLDWARSVGALSIHCWHKTLTSSWAKEIKKNGFLLLVYTVNEVELAKQLFAWGADGIFTDAPGRMLEAGLG